MKNSINTAPYTFHERPQPLPEAGPPFLAEFERHNPFRRSDWRWRRAEHLANTGQRLDKRRDDAWTRLAASWLLNRLPHSAKDTIEVLTEAERIRSGFDGRRLEVSAWLLARRSPEQIAETIGCTKPVVEAFEALFFNVTDRIDSRSWILLSVFGPAWTRHDQPRSGESVVMALAYFGGPVIADLAISMFQAGQLKPDYEHDLTTADGHLRSKLAMLFRLLSEPVSANPSPVELKKLLNLRELVDAQRPVGNSDFRRVFGAERSAETLKRAAEKLNQRDHAAEEQHMG